MMHEVFMSLLGFTGGLVVETPSNATTQGTFQISLSQNAVTEAEKGQINKIISLGWYYRELNSYIEKNGILWTSQSCLVYRAAFCLAIGDLLQEYAGDVADLDRKMSAEGPFPIGVVNCELQKYLLAFPAAYNCVKIAVNRKIKGCQFLDFLCACRTGVPTVRDVFDRMLSGVRIVFLKQCFAWMLYGELDDGEKEFFITERSRAGTFSRNATEGEKMFEDVEQQESSFDWTTTFTLRLEMIPESHVSSRLAAKILLCGKAVKMLMKTTSEMQGRAEISASGELLRNNNSTHLDYDASSTLVYRYLSGGIGVTIDKGKLSEDISEDDTNLTLQQPTVELSSSHGTEKVVDDILNKYANRHGYTTTEMALFRSQCQDILSADATNFVHLFEKLVQTINSTISRRLWIILRDKFQFNQFLVGLRNTYLLGKGELYQAFLDGILSLIEKSPQSDQQLDMQLEWSAVRSAAKLLNLDDDSLSSVLKFTVNRSTLSINNFNTQDLEFYGACKLNDTVAGTGHRSIRLCVASRESNDNQSKFSSADLRHAAVQQLPKSVSSTDLQSTIDGTENKGSIRYSTAALTISHQKYILKGFSAAFFFSCNWDTIFNNSFSPLNIEDSSSSSPFVIGTISCTLHDSITAIKSDIFGSSRHVGEGIYVNPYDVTIVRGIGRAVSVGVSISGRPSTTRPGYMDYFATVYVSVASPVSPSGASLNNADFSPGKSGVGLNVKDVNLISVSKEILIGHESDVSKGTRSRVLNSAASWALELEYFRDFSKSGGDLDSSTAAGSVSSSSKVVMHGIRARLVERVSMGLGASSASKSWDCECILDLDKQLRLFGGQSNVSVVAAGLDYSSLNAFNSKSPSEYDSTLTGSMCFTVSALSFSCRGTSLSTYPVASAVTSSRYPQTFSWMESKLGQFRTWMNLRLNFKFPTVFGVVVDAEAVTTYGRIFSALIKVRLIVHALERLWIVRSSLSTDRMFCQIRHAMHFFTSNLLFHLQVDVVDAEFSSLMSIASTASDFQTVLRAHRMFLSSLVRMSYIDNSVVQDAIDRVLQICLRFLVASSLLHSNEDLLRNGVSEASIQFNYVIMPIEELNAIKSDFFTQVSYLFQLMKKVENRGFIFRLDFNSFLSNLPSV